MSIIKCPECNLTNWATAVSCKRCKFCFQPEAAGAAENQPVQNSFDEPDFNSGQPIEANQPNFPTPNYRPQANHQSYYQPNYQPPQQKIGMAITSMVMGLVGCFLTAPIGLILGIVSLRRANSRPHEYGGKGFAIAGIALNAVGLLVLPIIAAIAIPNLLAARRAANEGSAIATVRAISAAEDNHMSGIGKRCADLKTLAATNLVDPLLAQGEKSGYRFMVVSLPTLRGDCEIHAAPLSPSHGTRSFYSTTEDGVIRAAAKNGMHASRNDPPIDGYGARPNNQTPKISY